MQKNIEFHYVKKKVSEFVFPENIFVSNFFFFQLSVFYYREVQARIIGK